MRSPLSLADSAYKYRNVIKYIFPKNTRQLSFVCSRDMDLEFYLSKRYQIRCSTHDYRLFDFWRTYMQDPYKVFDRAKYLCSNLDIQDYSTLYSLYYQQTDEYLRAGLLILSNRAGHRTDFFKDSLDPKNAIGVYDFLESHKHFILRDFELEYSKPFESSNFPSFTIVDCPNLFFENKIKTAQDTSFDINDVKRFMDTQKNWCVLTNKSYQTDKLLLKHQYYYLANDGKRSPSETNKILFYKT
tara:strand:+ start:657 stop:1385 length:729 start_codon:yes stop_codon:yes gene_type:complete